MTSPIQAARSDSKSPIFGMPVLDVEKAKTVLFVKRSLASGYARYRQRNSSTATTTMMLLGDAKKVTEDLIKAL